MIFEIKSKRIVAHCMYVCGRKSARVARERISHTEITLFLIEDNHTQKI